MAPRPPFGVLLAVLVALAPGGGSASEEEGAPTRAVSPPRLDGRGLALDGLLDEDVWRQAAVVRDLTRLDPVEGGPGFGEVEFRLFHDDVALYIGSRVRQPPGMLRAHIFPRDEQGSDDSILVYLKTFRDSESAYLFKVNPLGIQRDLYVIKNGLAAIPWDGVWDAEGRTFEDGYSVEVRIPFRSLRLPRVESLDLGITLGVLTGERSQLDVWPAVTKDLGPPLAQTGTLKDLRGLASSYNLDLLPSMVLRYGGREEEGQGFAWERPRLLGVGQPGLLEPGLDLRYGPSPGMVANLTLNPDFSQVEADSNQLDYNLRFPLFLAERRPFFLEGLDIFDTPIPLLYTRAINDAAAGLKLTGKEGRVIVGVLSAWDMDPAPSRLRVGNGLTSGAPVTSGFAHPLGSQALTTVGRVGLDTQGVQVGLFLADKRLLERGGPRSTATHDLASLDTRLRFADVYSVTGQVAFSRTEEQDREPLQGGLYLLNLRREDRRLLVEAQGAYHGSGFRAETSALSRVNHVPSHLRAAYKFETGGRWVMYVRPELMAALVRDATTFERLDWSLRPSLTLQLAGNTLLVGGYNHGGERFAGIDFPERLGFLNVDTAPTSWLTASLKVQGGHRINYDAREAFLGRATDSSLTVTLRPSTAAQVELSYIKSLFWRPEQEGLLQDVDLMRLKLSYNFNARWSVRAITQVDTYRGSLENNLLLTYLYRPGTALYLGFQDSEPLTAGSLTQVRRAVFMKASYLWQL